MTKFRQEMERATNLYHPQKSTNNAADERLRSFQRSMVVMWEQMAKLFHPQWTKNNGDIGGEGFRDWSLELRRFDAGGVLRGLDAVKNSGISYAPNLNKFIGFCKEDGGGNPSPGSGLDEQRYGKLKPTPSGVPLSWTIGRYSVEELEASPCDEDRNLARNLRITGETCWEHEAHG